MIHSKPDSFIANTEAQPGSTGLRAPNALYTPRIKQSTAFPHSVPIGIRLNPDLNGHLRQKNGERPGENTTIATSMSLRKAISQTQNPDRYETDYARWLKDHGGRYQPAGKPRYHPSDTDDISEGERVESEQNILRLQVNSKTMEKSKTNARFNHAEENVDIDEGMGVVQVSRYGSIMFPSTNPSEPEHQSSIGGSMARSSHKELGRCCVLGILFLIAFLFGIGLGMRRCRRRPRGINDMSKHRKNYEKKNLIETV